MNYIDKPCQVCDMKIEPLIDPIFETMPLITPYYKQILNDPDWTDIHYKSNASKYKFFILTTRLRYDVPLEYDINYKSYRYNNVMKYIVDLGFKADKRYQLLINDIIKTHPNHCMFFDMRQSFINQSHTKQLPSYWVKSIIPYCYHHLIDEQYDPILYQNQILINIDPDLEYKDYDISMVDGYYYNYNMVYDKLQDLIIDKLYDMYDQGVVVAHPIYNKNIIDNYNMIELYPMLYYTNQYIPNKTEFLIKTLKN